MYAIETHNLVKKFGDIVAVDGISIRVKEGEIFGLLGPNGAGKTTTISMLCCMIKPTSQWFGIFAEEPVFVLYNRVMGEKFVGVTPILLS